MKGLRAIAGSCLLTAAVAAAPVGTMSDLMVKIIYPTSDAVFYISTREPRTDAEWGELQAKTLMLAESANLLMMPGYARDQDRWMKDAQLMLDAGTAAYKAAKNRDVEALVAVNDALYESCVVCHQHYRRNYGRGSASMQSQPATQGAPTVVSVEGGAVRGTETDGIRVFKGLPYAAPPVGDLRWRPPQPPAPWKDTRDATAFGAECPQTQYGDGSIYIRPLQKQSEDCLFVNVWTPAKAGERLPVLVWIHGGALTRGSGISDTRDGLPIAKKGVVLVTLNYRLGPLGYLAHPELTAESRHHSSGNYGVLDQIAALEWVQKNIAVFGGDRSQVTIAGESAGSWSVNTLVASPLAKGLFVRAIGESGGRFGTTPSLTEDRGNTSSAEKVGLAFAKAAGADSLKALRATPADTLVALPGFRTQENVDGWVLPDEIRTIFAQKQHNNVPVLVGSNANEMTSLGGSALVPATYEDYKKRIAQLYGANADAFEAAYGVKGEADYPGAMLAVSRDVTFSQHMRSWARATVGAGSKAYLYYFTHVPPHPRAKELRAFHAAEIPYVFNVVPSTDPREAGFAYTDADRKLADVMSSYWVNFVKTGDPNGSGLPIWTPYDPAGEPYLELGTPIKSGSHLLKAELDFLERVRR
jgi:para-nitrobenzyl esterase